MIINNQFYIFTYAGSEPLNLMSVPAAISTDPLRLANYNTFIQSVDTIYASQNLNNQIPVFWTRKVNNTDPVGNNVVTYRPHPDSTLKQLESKQSYYIIVRNTDNLPLSVPMMGDAVVGFSNNNLAPSITGLNNIKLTNTIGNKHSLRPEITKLQPYETYSYVYKGINANWPVTISPISGTIKSSENRLALSSILSFCATSGCAGVVDQKINGTIANQCPSYNQKDLYSTLELEIKPVSFSGITIKSNPFTIECEDCLPRVRIKLNNDQPSINLVAGSGTTDFITKISNLEPTQNYNYEFISLGANWPAMFITPISGVIKTYRPNQDFTLNSKIVFCPTTGLCPSADSSVLDYTVDPKFIESFYTSLLLKITPTTCSEPYYSLQNNASVYSDPITIYCNDCL